jgi:acyl-CoA thioesterase I
MLAACCAVAIGCGRPTERNPATGQAVDARPAPQQPVSDTRPVIAAFGDSLTAGLGLEPGQSYPDRLQILLDNAGYRYRVLNMGVSGDTTTDGLERVPSVLALHPAIVVLEFGANDGLRGQPVSSAKQNLAAIIEALSRSGARILLAGMTLPRNYGPDYIRSFEQMYVDLAEKYKLARIPFLLEGVGGDPRLTQPDGLHPTAEGAEIMARTVMRYLTPLIAK